MVLIIIFLYFVKSRILIDLDRIFIRHVSKSLRNWLETFKFNCDEKEISAGRPATSQTSMTCMHQSPNQFILVQNFVHVIAQFTKDKKDFQELDLTYRSIKKKIDTNQNRLSQASFKCSSCFASYDSQVKLDRLVYEILAHKKLWAAFVLLKFLITSISKNLDVQ